MVSNKTYLIVFGKLVILNLIKILKRSFKITNKDTKIH